MRRVLDAALDPRVLVPVTLAALSALGYTHVSASDEQAKSYRSGFELCREMAFSLRARGHEKIIPRVPEELQE